MYLGKLWFIVLMKLIPGIEEGSPLSVFHQIVNEDSNQIDAQKYQSVGG